MMALMLYFWAIYINECLQYAFSNFCARCPDGKTQINVQQWLSFYFQAWWAL